MAGWLFDAASMLTCWAALIETICWIGDHTAIHVQAVACSTIALVLLGFAWTRISWFGRSFTALVMVAAGWMLLSSALRLASLLASSRS